MFKSNRQFKLWDYNVSHNQLLIRSPRTSTLLENIDVVFWGVEYASLSSSFETIGIRIASENDRECIARSIGGSLSGANVFFLHESDDRFFIISSGFKVLKNYLEIFDSSLVYFDRQRESSEYGDVLAGSHQRNRNESGLDF